MIIYIAIDHVEVKPFKVKTLAKPFLGVDLPCMSDVAETWWNAGGIFFRLPGHRLADSFFARCQTGRYTPRAPYTQPPLGVIWSCFIRVWLFAIERAITWLDLTWRVACIIHELNSFGSVFLLQWPTDKFHSLLLINGRRYSVNYISRYQNRPKNFSSWCFEPARLAGAPLPGKISITVSS
jgi:hypothetical protein